MNNIVNALNLIAKAILTVRITSAISNFYYYISSSAGTTVTTAGTYYKVAGTTAYKSLENFTHEDNKLTYTGTRPALVTITGNVSFSSDTSNILVTMAGAINGTVDPLGSSTHTLGVSGYVANVSGIALVTMQPGDYFELYCTCDNSGSIVTAEKLTIMCIS